MRSHYEVLQVEINASQAEIRSKYLIKVKESHPDRSGSNEEVIELYKAYECLSDDQKRREYDEKLSKDNIVNRIYPQVSLDQFDVSEDEETFSLPCRCGNEYIVTADDLESGLELLSCTGCTERVHVLYEMVVE
ncbi:DnaJ-domain-containing protein [Wallemia mellicola CBS 633.66]|nr:DnaJ-domain-containing protein [Wallemia mellicola CBS 633.66]EIM19971.1 DnaJ-domain-containing protein [Wallemia mellicola CBS 633.66]|eukprot:XP_006959902.1 DnaJ-domain-containing protein [Wallemia mellicola CBS 633.66]